jgi:hypothetical protein
MRIRYKPILSVAVALPVASLLSSCGSYDPSEAVKSPDGAMAAQMFVKDGGAAIASRVYIELSLPANQGTERIFEGSGGWPLEVRWIDDSRLLIKYCGADRIEYTPTVYYEANGIPSEAQVVTVTDARSVNLNGFGLRPCIEN